MEERIGVRGVVEAAALGCVRNCGCWYVLPVLGLVADPLGGRRGENNTMLVSYNAIDYV